MLNKSPPPVSGRRQHGRSASFSGFVSRLLPSRRPERGHAFRPDPQEDSPYSAADLVSGLAAPRSPQDALGSEDSDGGLARKVKSWSPHKHSTHKSRDNNHAKEIFDHRRVASHGSTSHVAASSPSGRTSSLSRLLGPVHLFEKSGDNARITATQDGEKREKSEMVTLLHISGPRSLPQEGQTAVGATENADACAKDEQEITGTQKMYADKKTRREQRRSLRESGDFLGVQGANPRTGYWDMSDATSSSGPSQVSEDTKRHLEEQARELDEKRRKYEAAKLKHQTELRRVQMLRDRKKREKAERKKLESKLQQRRHGRWKIGENGWSSVAEPGLSPIEQSLAGSPVRETAPDDRLFPMPSAADPNPYAHTNPIEEADYFGRRIANSPLARDQVVCLVDPNSSTHPNVSIRRKPVGSSPSCPSRNSSTDTIINNSGFNTGVALTAQSTSQSTPSPKKILRKDTPTTPGAKACKTPEPSTQPSTPTKQNHFLDKRKALIESGSPGGKKATAISYHSVLTNQVQIHQPSGLSRQVSYQGKIIKSLDELPPVSLKDPTAARVPLRLQPKRSYPQVWAPPTIIDTEPDRPMSYTNTSTITTTGCEAIQHPLAQLDGQDEIFDTFPLKQPSLQRKQSRIPLRTSSHPNNRQSGMPNGESPAHQADIVISSEHLLTPTKQRTARLCCMTIPGEKAKMKNTHISTSMCPPSPKKQKTTVQNAALVAFQQVSTVPKNQQSQIGESPAPPRVEKQKEEIVRDINKEAREVLDGKDGTGSPSRIKRKEAGQITNMHQLEKATEEQLRKRAGGLVIWRAEPDAARTGAGKIAEGASTSKKGMRDPRQGVSPAKTLARPARVPVSIDHMFVRVLQTAWWIVGPVFDPHSELRNRWELHRLTWRDVSVFVAAALFSAAMFLITVVFARVLATGLQVIRAFVAFVKLLTGS